MRGEVLWFAAKMEEKLKENDHKGGWEECSTTWLLGRLYDEISELAHALGDSSKEEVIKECADIANFAMMIADVVKSHEQ